MDIGTADGLAIDSEVFPLAGDWLLDVVELSTFFKCPGESVDRELEELVDEDAVSAGDSPTSASNTGALIPCTLDLRCAT
jgi:hypothetical protein